MCCVCVGGGGLGLLVCTCVRGGGVLVCTCVVWCVHLSLYMLLWTAPPYSSQLHVTLTNDNNKVFKALQSVEPVGKINFVTGVRIAHVRVKIPPKYNNSCY